VTTSGGGLRLIAAAVMTPWLVGYGVTGAWAVASGARAAADGLAHVDVGYGRPVTPAGLVIVGALAFAAFAVLLAAALLLLLGSRGSGRLAGVCAAAVALTAGSVWAAARGGLDPGLWLLFFAGLLYASVLSFAMALRATRQGGRGEPAGP
jgi:hypothetical protein